MRRGGGTGRPTLGQATGGRPGQVRTPKAGYQHRGLGLGLNLKPGQARGFQQAAQGGQSGQWLAAHPGIQQRIGRVNPVGAQSTAIQNFMGTGQSQRIPRPPTTGPQRGGQSLSPPPPQTLGGMRGPQQDQFGAPGGLPMPNYGVNPGMQSVLSNRFGQGWSGDNASMQPQLAAQAGGYGYGGQRGPNPYLGMQPMPDGGQPAMGAPPQQAPAGGQQYASFGQPPRFQGMEGQQYPQQKPQQAAPYTQNFTGGAFYGGQPNGSYLASRGGY